MNDIIEAADRFGSPRKTPAKPTALDALRRTKRISLPDRALLASRLGQIASDLSPERPQTIAKIWFDQAWNGDRWAKRKRLICFPGEMAPDPRDDAAYVASGSDWAALIELAAKSNFPAAGPTAEAERVRFSRDVLRGTAFLPALNIVPLRAESAQSLMVMLVEKILDRIEKDTDLRRLWEVLETTPFDIESYAFERPERPALPGGDFLDSYFEQLKYTGDSYSTGALGAAANLATQVSVFRFGASGRAGYRFKPSTTDHDISWACPVVRLGLRGHSRSSRLFVLPPNFAEETCPNYDPDEEALDDLALDWLVKKGLMAGHPYEDLPEIPFDPVQGYGWREFPYELVQPVKLEVCPKADGSPGIWVSAWFYDLSHYYPRLRGFDPLAAAARSDDWSNCFLGMPAGSNTSYEFLDWPSNRADFMPNGEPPAEAAFGLLEAAYEDRPTIEGWIDDLDNAELQDLLFRNDEQTRFCPSFPSKSDVPPPCRPGTIAAAIFANASCDVEDRVGRVLVHQANTISSAGLGFHHALLSHHRSVIERMWSD